MTAIHCLKCGTENPEGVKFCHECGSSLAVAQSPGSDARLVSLQQAAPQGVQEKLRAAKASVKGERKPVTILFADIVGSTSIAEKLDPEEWKEVVAGAHQRVGEAIYRYEGTIAQLLGDGVLAFFGAPITHEDDPIRAVRAALDIQESVRQYAGELAGVVEDFQMRIGINTGTVVIGDIGTDMHVEYLAIGDAVNVAARLESAAKPGTVLISEGSARLIGADFELVDCGDIPAKGKSEPVHGLEVVRVVGIPEVRRGPAEGRTPYIGRDSELEILRSKMELLRDGQGQIIAVLGEPGIGKSRLVEEARALMSEQSGLPIRWLEGRSLSYGGSLSFWPVTQLLLSDLGLSDGAPEVKLKIVLKKRVDELFGEQSTETFPYLAHLLGLANDPQVNEHIQSLDGETLKRQTLLAIAGYFKEVAKMQPTALVLEDLHWADLSSLEALERLLPLTDSVSMMIFMPMRIERDHGSWRLRGDAETDFPHRFTEVILNRLPEAEADQLVHELLGAGEAAQEVRELIRSHSEGNPLYLEEVVQHLTERGLIERVNGSWQATHAIEDVGIPDTLEGVLLARIDLLEPTVRNTLQLASVIGKNFLYQILEAISEVDRELEWHLTQLQREDLVRETTRAPELEYAFKHSLIQEAAYMSLLHERREEYHARVGEALEELFPGREEEFLGLLAHHYYAAAAHEKALRYLIAAGDKARLEEANVEALDYYERALQLGQEMGDTLVEARTWLKIGLVHLKEFNFDAAHEAHEAAFRLQETREMENQRRKARAMEGVQEWRVLRALHDRLPTTLDSASILDNRDERAIRFVFAGLTEVDSETNVVPHVARSWKVLDGGRRYVFYLRDDVFWTDGASVTANDFRWAWLRNLSRESGARATKLLDDIVGARHYREGRSTDPDSVGIRVLDPLTLEVSLNTPVPYFMYLVANTVTFPVPQHVVERYGEAWWRPEHIVSNGAFRVKVFEDERLVLVQNPAYFGDVPGNIERYEWTGAPDDSSAIETYTRGEVDIAWGIRSGELPVNLARGEIRWPSKYHLTLLLLLNPRLPPLDDDRVRRSLAHAIYRSPTHDTKFERGPRGGLGGIIPRGMPGHSPEIGCIYDLSKAIDYLRRAGFPKRKNLPGLVITSRYPDEYEWVCRQWEDGLGIVSEIVELTGESAQDPYSPDLFSTTHVHASGWVADYPDPDSYFRTSFMYEFLSKTGWEGFSVYDALVHEALQSQDRKRRLEIYRQIDRYLVEEDVVVIPLNYGLGPWAEVAKPWVHGLRRDAMGHVRLKDISIDKH